MVCLKLKTHHGSITSNALFPSSIVKEGTFLYRHGFKTRLARLFLRRSIESTDWGAEAGPAMACQYCSAVAEVCTMDQVWTVQVHGLPGLILHIFSGLSTG